MSKILIRCLTVCIVMAISVGVCQALPTFTGAAVTPSEATANAQFTFSVNFNDNGYTDGAITLPPTCTINVNGGTDIPLVEENGAYVARLTSSPMVSTVLGTTLVDFLTANANGTPRTITATFVLTYADGVGNPHYIVRTVDFKIHDAYVGQYGGLAGDRDYLVSYPFNWPEKQDLSDPLTTDATDGRPVDDDGASSSLYTFTAHYRNLDGLPPRLWFPAARGDDNGIYLQIAKLDTDDYTLPPRAGIKAPGRIRNVLGVPVGYYTTSGTGASDGEAGTRYRFVLQPDSTNYYEGMEVGRYHYFFSASDDNPLGFGDYGDYDFNGAAPLIRPGDYAPDGSLLPTRNRMDLGILLDRPSLAPDPFTYRDSNPLVECTTTCYPFASTEDLAFADSLTVPGGKDEVRGGDSAGGSIATHPFVTVGLRAVADLSDPSVHADSANTPAGGARYLGTIPANMLKRAVNPLIPNQGGPGQPAPSPVNVLWSETAGGTSEQVWTFRVIYQGVQIDPAQNPGKPNKLVGKDPASIIIKIWNTVDGTGTPIIGVMEPEVPAAPTSSDYMTGVIYKYQTKLTKGPHCFSFEASDGVHTAIFPRRPDEPHGSTGFDPILPADFGPNNDVINAPYINTKPVLSLNSVTPTRGLDSSSYVYQVLYTDADGNKPNKAKLIIETNTGQITTVNMARSGGTNYKGGVYYTYTAAAAAGTVLAQGVRHYYFEFTDDWGRVTDPNDMVVGETVTFPTNVDVNNVDTWFAGPIIVANNPPTLKDPAATASNSLSMPDTQWTFRVTYSDIENQAPGFINLLLGKASAHTLDAFITASTTSVIVTPANPGTPGVSAPKLLDVVGVWTTNNPSLTDTNYYTGGSFNQATGEVTLGTPLPSAGIVYVTYHSTPVDWASGESGGIISLVKLDPSDTDYTKGIIYTTPTANPIKFLGPASKNTATDPPPLHYYGFAASDGLDRARYTTSGARPSPGAFQIEAETPASADRRNYQLSFNSYPASTRPDPVAPIVVGALEAGTGNTPHVLEDPYVTLTNTVPDPDTTTVLTKGDGAVKTQYKIDYAQGIITLGAQASITDVIKASYWFADYLPPVQYNSPPTLIEGRVSPEVGSSTTVFTYSVIYKDTDGLNGTAPSFVQVVIDGGEPQDMVQSVTGTPIYRNGVEYTYQTKLSPNVPHRFYFIASDGLGNAVFDAGSAGPPVVSPSRSSLGPINPVFDINGPFLNEAPVLKGGLISPTVGRRNDPINYSVFYRDVDNDAPGPGYPMTWIASPAWHFNGGILDKVYNTVTLITDTTQTWTPSQFKDQPLNWKSGKRTGITDLILDNTQNMLIVSGALDTDPNTRPELSDEFSILEGTTGDRVSALDFTAAGFVDTAQNYTVNILAGERIQMVTGGAIGKVYTVAANTSTMMAISARLKPVASNDPSVASDGVLSGDTYSIHDILVGPVTVNLDNGGVVSMQFGNTPEWTADQFNGLAFQMMTGAAASKSYTILSNTTDTLFLAQTKVQVAADAPVTGDVVRLCGFTMAKDTPSETDYTVFTGVGYHIVLPGLGLGEHSAHWRASNSPSINGNRVTFQAEYPNVVDLDGPTIALDPPPANTAPELANALVLPAIGRTVDDYTFSIDYRDFQGDPPGPHDGVNGFIQLVVDAEVNGQIITRTYKSSVDPIGGGPWPVPTANLTGWRTINSTVFTGFKIDHTLTPLPAGRHRFHFEASDGWWLTRFPSNPENDPSVIVNSRPILTLPAAGGVMPVQGNTGTAFKFRVIYTDADNQTPSSINLILNKNGVDQAPLAMAQEDPTDTNFTDGAVFFVTTTLSAGTYTYRFTASDPVESASPTLPVSGPVVRGTNTAPTLIVDSGSVTPASSAFASNSFVYSVFYRDPDGDVPGTVSAPDTVIVDVYAANGTTVLDTLTMAKVNPTDTDYSAAAGIEYRSTAYHFTAPGAYYFQFSATDGLAAATGETMKKSGPVVNTPPVLSLPTLTPVSGLSSDLFTFTVKYQDADDVGPLAAGYVRVVLTKGATVTKISLIPQASSGWSAGVTYSLATQLAGGVYSYHFEASDGLDTAVSTVETSGPIVTAAPELRNATVTPATGRSTDIFTYSVTLANPDGTGPAEIKVFIDGSDEAIGKDMSKVNPSDTNFVSGVQYQYQTTLASGGHTWFIRAKVAGQTIYPVSQTPSVPASGPIVNNPPVLTEAIVTPSFGRPTTPFTFSVKYTDADGIGPAAGGYVRVRVSGVATPVTLTTSEASWGAGVTYSGVTTLPGGLHTFYFEASDGIEAVRLPDGVGSFDGPTVSSPPTLTSGSVTPLTGSLQTVFTYRVVYTSVDNNPPAANSVKVLIDGAPYTMAKLTAGNNYAAGITYTYSTTLSPGTHSYLFQASDGVDLVSSALGSGPTVEASGLTINAAPNPAQLGGVVTISGNIVPAAATTFTLALTRPGGTLITKSVTSSASGAYTTTFVADEVGSWNASIAPDSSPGASVALSPPLQVQPATLRVQGGVVDMISSPVASASGDPGAVFGTSDAIALGIVRWDTLTASYKYYGSSIDFPEIYAGSGFWIRPSTTKTLTLTGTLADQTIESSVPLEAGWNQIGSGFVQPVSWAATLVRYNGATVNLSQAASNGWVHDYAWGYDPVGNRYFLVRGTGGEATVLNPFRGYWLRAFVPCTLLIQPPVVP